MKAFYTTAVFLTLGVSSLYAQNQVVTGKIMDKNDSFSLPGATLKLLETNRYTVSDQSGSFEFLNVPSGTYTLVVDYIGYSHYEQKIVVEKGKVNNFEVLLESSSRNLQEVQVLGDIAKGQAKALNQQRNNSNISNIISSDQVGRFPDQNVGDALKRVPGITMQNDQGEARNIIIRGLAPELNSVTLNGDRIPSAEGDNRNVQMDLIPSDMISTIEVNKTLTPDMDADAIGGSVNLITRAVPNKQRFSATMSGGYAPIRDKGMYNGSLIYGNRFANNKIGIVASGTMQANNFGSDNIEAVWKQDKYNNLYTSEFQIRKYDVQRIRRSFSLSSDYQINQRNKIEFSGIYNWRDDRENRFRVTYKGISPVYDASNAITGYTGEIRRQTKGGIGNRKNDAKRLETQKVYNFSLRGEHILSPKLDMDWAATYSKASEDRPNERYIDFNQKKMSLGVNLEEISHPSITELNVVDSKFKLREITENHNYTDESELGMKLNFRVPLSVVEGQKGRLRFGGRLRLKEKDRNNVFYNYAPTGTFGGLTDVPNQYFTGDHFQPGSQYAPGLFATKDYLGSLDLSNADAFKEKAVPSEYLAKNYHADERVIAEYVRWDQNLSDATSIILGLRAEHTKIKYRGNYVLDEDELVGQVTNENAYTNILPSISLKHNFSKNTILRAAFTTGIARPNYYALAPYVSLVTDEQEIAAGNPDLKATYAKNFDVMFEHYFQSIGLISGGAFYKNLDNFIYKFIDLGYNKEKFAASYPGQENVIPDGENWKFVQFRNGDKVHVYGYEVAFQRQFDFFTNPFLKGFGIYANYTYTHSKAKGISGEDGVERTGLGLPKTAPHMLNGSLSWENNKFSARISANYTAAYLDEIAESAFGDAYYDKQFFLDANASYKITPKFRIFGEANNLTNQPLRYYQGQSQRVMQLEYYKPKYNFGVKFDL